MRGRLATDLAIEMGQCASPFHWETSREHGEPNTIVERRHTASELGKMLGIRNLYGLDERRDSSTQDVN
jgi:hypothetical protein